MDDWIGRPIENDTSKIRRLRGIDNQSGILLRD
jgi:hypothetical protein